MRRRTFLALAASALSSAKGASRSGELLHPENFRHYIDDFNATFREEVVNLIPDARAWDWLKANIPFFACPDREIEELYYYRWWAYRKHIKQTPVGLLITEFLKPVKHAGEYNSLSCALGHHVAEGRWLWDPQYVDGDLKFWLRTGPGGGLRPNLHQFSGWVAAMLYDRWLADGRREVLLSWLDAALADYRLWEQERLTTSGLFWQRDVSDGMEVSISGGRKVKNIRPSINSYMYGNARAIAAMAEMSGRRDLAGEYAAKAGRLKSLVEEQLWNREAAFFETRLESGALSQVREAIGYTPWYFGLPDDRPEYAAAWKQLMDPQGFFAPYGPTTAERRHPGFQIAYEGDDCQWNGPSWPFATTITLRALANVLHHYRQTEVSIADYFRTFEIYSRSQHLKLANGRVVPYIDENLNPFTGDWLARARKLRKPDFYDRGAHYNHSGYADLVITGIAGLRPRADSLVEVHPLAPAGQWDWFCLDRVPYNGRSLTIFWDATGKKFGRGRGLTVLANGRRIAKSAVLGRVTGQLG
jgi:hypothetical protein